MSENLSVKEVLFTARKFRRGSLVAVDEGDVRPDRVVGVVLGSPDARGRLAHQLPAGHVHVATVVEVDVQAENRHLNFVESSALVSSSS